MNCERINHTLFMRSILVDFAFLVGISTTSREKTFGVLVVAERFWAPGGPTLGGFRLFANNSEDITSSSVNRRGREPRPPHSSRALEHCNWPSLQGPPEEGKVLEGHRLRQVHVIIRHGDRAPMSDVLPVGAVEPLQLPCLTRPEYFPPDVASRVKEFMDRVQIVEGGRHRHRSRFPNETNCSPAMLTGLGAVQLLEAGFKLRKVYQENHGLLRNWGQENINIVHTPHTRTWQSAISFLSGLLPGFRMSKVLIGMADFPLFCGSATAMAGVPCECASVGQLTHVGDRQVLGKLLNSKLHTELLFELSSLANESVGRLPRMKAFWDNLNGYLCHNMSLPCDRNTTKCFTLDLMNRMWAVEDEQSQLQAENIFTRSASRLSTHHLLMYIRKHMQAALGGRSPVRFALFSGHDHTITPLMQTLGTGADRAPPFAARLVFELYESRTNSSNQFLRILYNGRAVTKSVVFCRGHVGENGLCPMHRFQNFTDQTTVNFRILCAGHNFTENGLKKVF